MRHLRSTAEGSEVWGGYRALLVLGAELVVPLALEASGPELRARFRANRGQLDRLSGLMTESRG